MDTVSYILLKKYIEDLLADAGALAGKSAYQYAVEGGYTGTEAEFAAKMAEEIPSVDNTLTKPGQAADALAVGERFKKVEDDMKTSGVQSDWNVNDETNPAYIKNRPFYAGDSVLTELLPETTLQFTDGTASITDAPDLMLEKLSQNDQTYIVIWDGTEYEVTASPFDGIPCLGNISLELPELENTGEPFLFLYLNQWVVVTNDAGAEHTISVNHAEQAIHKLPSKFLVDDVGNKLPFFNLKEMGMEDITGMNQIQPVMIDTTKLRYAMTKGQIKIAFGFNGTIIQTILNCGINAGNITYASALILNPQKIDGLDLSPVIVALGAMEGGLYFILKEIDSSAAQINEIDALIGGDA